MAAVIGATVSDINLIKEAGFLSFFLVFLHKTQPGPNAYCADLNLYLFSLLALCLSLIGLPKLMQGGRRLTTWLELEVVMN